MISAIRQQLHTECGAVFLDSLDLDSDVVELMEEVASVCALWCCDKKASEAEATCSQLAKLMKLAMSALADLEAEKEQARDAGKKGKKGKMSKQGRKKR